MSIVCKGSSGSLYFHPPTEDGSDVDADDFDDDDQDGNDDEVDYSVGEKPPVGLLIVEPPTEKIR